MIRTADAILIGGGIMGLSTALALRKQGAEVLVVDRAEPGREASWAAAGMLAHCDHHAPAVLRPLAIASARMYPEFVHELEDESGEQVGYSRQGTIVLDNGESSSVENARPLDSAALKELERDLVFEAGTATLLPEAAVDPRALISAAMKAARHRGIHISSGAEVVEVETTKLGVTGVRTSKTRYAAPVVVNCAGAWACQIPPVEVPTRPVKGHMLAVAPAISFTAQGTPTSERLLRHVVRQGNEVYLVPRPDGRIVIGSTLEEAGYDKRTDPDVVMRLHEKAAHLLPGIAQARILESWTGLRPGTPDNLPILGATPVQGYLVATGHYRDGILLAPVTAQIIARLATGSTPEFDLNPFSLKRFSAE